MPIIMLLRESDAGAYFVSQGRFLAFWLSSYKGIDWYYIKRLLQIEMLTSTLHSIRWTPKLTVPCTAHILNCFMERLWKNGIRLFGLDHVPLFFVDKIDKFGSSFYWCLLLLKSSKNSIAVHALYLFGRIRIRGFSRIESETIYVFTLYQGCGSCWG